MSFPTDSLEARRAAFLLAHLNAAKFRLRMIAGERFAFADEAEALFGVRPELKPLSDYDGVLAQIAALLPGEAPLAERLDTFAMRFAVPPDRREAVMRAAIAACRARTMAHIALPENESFTLEFVTGQSWSGYNWFKGNAHSLIQINTDGPIFIDRAVDLGCHEGYPGHHAHNTLLEDRLVRGRGWMEHAVFPLFSPIAFIAEGTGNAGIDLVFPGPERHAFERDVLFPLAGLDPAEAERYRAVRDAALALAGARMTIAQMWLDGEIASREEALDLLQRYQLQARPAAERGLRFIETYRSYIINYGLGEDWVNAHLSRAGATQAPRWAAMEKLLSEPTLPADLR